MKIKSYKDLIVWQKSFQLTLAVYGLTASFPKSELFGLTSQLRRAAVSVASNIAEGYERRSQGDLLRFLFIAFASLSELETQIMIAEELKLAKAENFIPVKNLITEVSKMLYAFIKKIKSDRALAVSSH